MRTKDRKRVQGRGRERAIQEKRKDIVVWILIIIMIILLFYPVMVAE